MKNLERILVIIVALVSTRTALAAPAAGAPAWCKAIGDEDVDASTDDALKDDVLRAIPAIVGALCQPDADARAQKAKIEAARSEWSKKLDMTESDWKDAAAWAVAMQSKRHPATTLPVANPKLGWAAMDSIDQYIVLQQPAQIAENYLADAFGPTLSEAGRLSYLLTTCLSSSAREVQWAICQPDLDAFDAKKLVTELRADKKHSGYERFIVRLAGLKLLPSVLKKEMPRIKAARAQDPAFEKMFQIAADTRATWTELWKANAPLVDLALQLDDARVSEKRSALKGCEEKTWTAFKAAVGSVAAKRFGNLSLGDRISEFPADLLSVAGSDPKAYLASIALHMCEAETPDGLVIALGSAFLKWSGHRGPRTSTLTNIRAAGLELDDRSRTIDYPTVVYPWFAGIGGGGALGYGTVAKLKRQDGTVYIEFGAKLEKQFTCLKSTYTKRIQRILPDGTLVYELNCLKWGTVTVDKRSNPATVKARYADGLKTGMMVLTVGEAVIAVWPKADTRIPSIVAGVAVK